MTIGGVANTSSTLSDRYGSTDNSLAQVFEMEQVTYEIATVGGVTGLYETRNGGTRKLVLDNVTDFQILYGIDSEDSDGNADHYVTWTNVPRVADITSINVMLTLVVTRQNGNSVTRNYSFTVKLRDMGLDV